MAFEDWSTTAIDNSTLPGINWAEGQLPPSINGSARQTLADLAAWGRKTALSPVMFGADPTGTDDSTDAFNDFFTYWLANGDVAMIPAGNFLIELDAVVLDNSFVSTPFGILLTAGPFLTKFTALTNKNGAFFTVSNGAATSAAGRFWEGGMWGGMSFYPNGDTDPSVYTDMDGLRLNGIEYCQFGVLYAEDIGGSVLKIPRNFYTGNNPDPHHVNQNKFAGIAAARIGNSGLYNDNYVGLSGNFVEFMRIVDAGGNGWYGYGAANALGSASMAVDGWAFGDQGDILGGRPSRFMVLGGAELSPCQYGIDLTSLVESRFNGIRFTHNMVSGQYWPRTAIKLNPATALTQDVVVEVWHRVDAGGVLADLGQFVDFNNGAGNTTAVKIIHRLDDNAGLGIGRSRLYTNLNANAMVDYRDERGNPIVVMVPHIATIRAETTSTVANGARALVPYATEIADYGANFTNTAGNYKYTTPGYGIYRMRAKLCLAMAIGTVFSMCFAINGTERGGNQWKAADTDAHVYSIEMEFECAPGTEICVKASQNSGAAINIGTVISAYDNLFEIELVS